MENRVEEFINQHQLFPEGATIVVGVSGGPDSMALFHFLYERQKLYGIRLVCCSVDHGLRGETSKADLDLVRKTAENWNIPFEGLFVDVSSLKEEKGIGTQEAARDLRFKAFEAVLAKYASRCLVLAQHGDDQVETMLMQHVRGGFGRTLAGMPVRRDMPWGEITRPFLCVTKADILKYCDAHRIPYRQDESNLSDDYTRNRFRHYVLPFLKKENPQVHQRFQQQSEWLYEEEAFWEDLTKEKLAGITLTKTGKSYVLALSHFAAFPVPLQRRILHLILNYLYQSIDWKPMHQTIHIDLLLKWLKQANTSGEWSLPGPLEAKRVYDQFIIKVRNEPSGTIALDQKELPLPGKLLTAIGEFKLEVLDKCDEPVNDQSIFLGDFSAIHLPLSIRSYKSGDFIRVFGHSGSKKVSRLFIDQKVPKEWRHKWPIVLDGEGNILWVPLLKRSHLAPCNPETSSTIKIRFSPSKDFGRIS
ncbi:MAG TPA: tRNA lysidine(34) synthetase TilS [Sporolactobacillaceae bacterium]|nr:tRNA lysidine(34) synthetase TilS [Sporolactobacillaceae bacterium]